MRAPLVYASILALGCARFVAASDAPTDRQAEVRERGDSVMPFSVGDTLHAFEKTDQGGVQTVTARAGHTDQIPMIRRHLDQIAESFSTRDFSQPARIHGAQMSGLADLRRANPSELGVAYRDIDGGAQITYTTKVPRIRRAIHRWFDAQLADHGKDATAHIRH